MDYHFVMLAGAHDIDAFMDSREWKTMGDDLLGVDQPSFHQADGFGHGQRVGPKTGVHTAFEKMGIASIKLELLVSRNSENSTGSRGAGDPP